VVQFKREGDYTLKLEADAVAVKTFDAVTVTVKNYWSVSRWQEEDRGSCFRPTYSSET
jgi:hypothetical protein